MNKSILIVEDEKDLRDLYELLLSSQGYTIYTAENGEIGLKELAAHNPDLVLLDISMPVMNGKDFMKNTDLNEYASTVFIAFTNLSDSDTYNEMMELGVDDMVLKSKLTPSEIVQLVASHIR